MWRQVFSDASEKKNGRKSSRVTMKDHLRHYAQYNTSLENAAPEMEQSDLLIFELLFINNLVV